jgi:hypothetical protein
MIQHLYLKLWPADPGSRALAQHWRHPLPGRHASPREAAGLRPKQDPGAHRTPMRVFGVSGLLDALSAYRAQCIVQLWLLPGNPRRLAPHESGHVPTWQEDASLHAVLDRHLRGQCSLGCRFAMLIHRDSASFPTAHAIRVALRRSSIPKKACLYTAVLDSSSMLTSDSQATTTSWG